MDATIRPFRPADYVAVAGVISAACPDQSWTAEQLEHADKHRDLRCLIRRWVAEVGDQVVGTALYDQVASMYNPRKFVLRGAVRPEIQGQGIGSALYEIVTTALVPLDPISLLVQDVREDQVRGITLLEHRSFRKVLSAWESRLDVTSFDPGPFARVVDRLSLQGIRIKTLRELESDLRRTRKLYDLLAETEADVPIAEQRTRLDYDHFVQNMLTAPQLNPDSFFVAVSTPAAEYVGMSILWVSKDGVSLQSGMTGVSRAYRRRGIGLALKVRAIAWARTHGYVAINTRNATNNWPILAVNERLGFVKQWLFSDFLKVLKFEAV